MAHIHEKIDFTASVFIVREGRVLLHKHKKLGIWLQPGGHIELDEDPNQAAVREALEETGLDVELIGSRASDPVVPGDLIPPSYINRHHFNDEHEHVDLIYFGRPTGGTLRAEEGTNTELRWFSRDEIERNDAGMFEKNRYYALAALEEIG